MKKHKEYSNLLNCLSSLCCYKSNSSYLFLFFILICVMGINSSCKKLVEVDPPVTSTTADGVFANDVTAIAVMTGIYSSMSNSSLSTTANGFNSIIKRVWS